MSYEVSRQTATSAQLRDMAGYFDRASLSWDSRSLFREETVRAVFAMLGSLNGSKILDVGCGTGVLFPTLLSLQPGHVTGLDLSYGMVCQARKKFPESRRLSILRGDFYEFSGEGYDLITVYNAYPHFLDRRRFAWHAYDLLAPKGRLLVFHDLSRSCLNALHRREGVCQVSSPLQSCENEAAYWRDLFQVDIAVDTEQMYVLSGVVKP